MHRARYLAKQRFESLFLVTENLAKTCLKFVRNCNRCDYLDLQSKTKDKINMFISHHSNFVDYSPTSGDDYIVGQIGWRFAQTIRLYFILYYYFKR